MNSVFEKLIKTEKFIFITRQKISVGKLMMAKMLLRIGLRLFPGSRLVCILNLSKKVTPSKKGARYAYLQCKESNPIALFDNAIEKDCMEWDGKIYKSIGYTIQASDTDEIVEEAFEYIAKGSFRFLVDNVMMSPSWCHQHQ